MRATYDVIGSGPPVVFVHGGFSRARVFGYQMLSLSRNNRVVAIDLPGHGRARWDPARPWFDQAVESVVSTVRELALDRPMLVGWSIGANVARAALAELSKGRLVLVGAPSKALDENVRRTVERFLLGDFPRYARSVIRSFIFSLSSDSEEWLFQMAISTPVEVVSAAMLGDIGELPDVPSDAVIVHGVHDQVVSVTERLQGGAEEHLFENSGHVPFIEERDRFDGVIEALARR